MELKAFDFELTEALFKNDQETYDRTFFQKLQKVKSEMEKVEKLQGQYAEASPVEIDQAERHYFQLIDDLNDLDMKIRKDVLKL